MGNAAAVKVLLVEDDDRLAFNLKLLLESEGYEVARLVNGLDLMEQLEVHRPAVILLDVMLSWVNGYDLCRGVKESPRWSGTPVVMISGLVSEGHQLKGREAGCDDYFTKPLDLDRLFDRLGELAEGPR
ncbi:MAG: response regulator [Candidatus Methylomirabilis sp.]|nr:response regulator [Deltaproteobacteria bacterium]